MPAPIQPLPAGDLDHILAHTRGLWAGARDQSFFITGGTGFFGRWLLESFTRANDSLSLGMRAMVLTRDRATFLQNCPHLATRGDLEFVQGDVRTFSFPDGRFAYVIHAATEVDTKLQQVPSNELLDVIIGGTRRVLAFAEQTGVKRFLFISSGAVYGRQPPELAQMAEDYSGLLDPLPAGSAYGQGKRAAEHLCTVHAEQHGYDAMIARGFAFIGPLLPLDSNYAIGNFIRDAMRGVPIRMTGDGTPLRSYLYASDLAIWLWTILFRGQPARVYNVGSEAAISVVELARLVQQTLNAGDLEEITGSIMSGQSAARYIPSVTRAELELGLKMRIPLIEAIRRTARWHHSV